MCVCVCVRRGVLLCTGVCVEVCYCVQVCVCRGVLLCACVCVEVCAALLYRSESFCAYRF